MEIVEKIICDSISEPNILETSSLCGKPTLPKFTYVCILMYEHMYIY